MPAVIGFGVTLQGFEADDFSYTWNLNSAVLVADLGKPMTLDTSADNTIKVAGDGDTIIGGLLTFEDRLNEGIKVGTLKRKGTFVWDYTTAPARGVGVVGAAVSGKVKSAGGPIVNNFVTRVNTTDLNVTVVLD